MNECFGCRRRVGTAVVGRRLDRGMTRAAKGAISRPLYRSPAARNT